MKQILLLLVVAILFPVVTIVIVNESSPKPLTTFLPEKCTRYCHNISCEHQPEKSPFGELYTTSIYWLGNNAIGLTYKEMNILVFVVLWPGFMLLLLMLVLLNHYYLRTLNRKLAVIKK